MSRGVVLMAVNNNSFDYIRMAEVNAHLINKYMGCGVALITDQEGSHHPILETTNAFDTVITYQSKETTENLRIFRDTIYHTITDNFKNTERSSVFDLSPYDESLLIDVDYLIMSDVLNNVWGSVEDVMINRDATSLMYQPLKGQEYRLNDFGIRMVWATGVYFQKDKDRARLLFKMVEHIREHWEFYRLVYNFPNMMFRNDYAFAIAIHTLNGYLDNNEFKSLPDPVIYSATDKDQLYKVDENGLLFFANDPKEEWKFYAVRASGVNVHCMNKISLARNLDNFKVLYE